MSLKSWFRRFFAAKRLPIQTRSKRNTRPLYLEHLEDRTLLSATIWTDKPDYPPTQTALISGSGFEIGETIQLQVVRTDGIADYPPGNQTWQVTDGGAGDLDGVADGNFQTTWYVDSQYVGASLLATADGLSSGLTASVAFTDASPVTSAVAVTPSTTNTAPTVTANVKETGSGSANIAAAEFFIDTVGANGTGTAMNATDGAFNSKNEDVTKALTAAQFAALSEGTHTIYVHGKDVNGNWDVTPVSITFVKDTVAPTITAISDTPDPFSPNADGVKDTSTISYTLSEATTVTIKIYDASNNLVRTLDNAVLKSSGANSDVWNGKNDGNAVVANGTYTYKIDATDAAGNVATQQTGTVTVDATNPSLTSVSDTPDPFSPNADSIKDTSTISYTLSETATVTIKIYNSSNVLVRTLVNAASRSSGANSDIWDGMNDASLVVANGVYTYKIDATDAAGNVATQATGIVTLDTVNPALTAVSDTPDPFSPNADTIKDTTTISYTLSEAATVTIKIYDSNNMLIRMLVNAASRSSGANSDIWNGQDDGSNVVANGTYTYKIDATDAAGNIATQQSGTVSVDTTSPSATLSFPAAGGIYNGTSWTNISGTAADTGAGLGTVEVSILRNSTGKYWNGTNSFNSGTESFFVTTGTSSWSYAFAVANFPTDGSYTVHVRVTDAAGNVNTSTSATFTVDTTIPATTGVSDTPDPFSPNADGVKDTSTISYTLSEAATVTIKIYDANNLLVRTLVNAASQSSGAHTAVWDGMNDAASVAADGVYTYKIDATDAAGNLATQVSGTVLLDTTSPAITGVADTPDPFSPNGDGIKDKTTISYTLSETATITVRIYDSNNTLVKTLVNAASRSAGANSEIWNGRDDSNALVTSGVYTYKIDATDAAGNVATQQTGTVTVDRVPPVAPGVALTDDTGALSDDLITSDGALTLSGIEIGAVVEYSTNGGTTWTSSFTAVEGANSVQVRQTDTAGNPSAVTTFSFTLDTTAPVAPDVALTDDTGALSDDLITSDGALTVTPENADALVEYNNNGAGWSSTFTAVEGTNDVLVRQTDLAGNVSDETAFSFTLDTTAPVAPDVALTDDTGALSDDLITSDGALTVTPENADALVEYNNNGAGWSSTFTAVEGTNDVLVRQTDLAGNVSDETAFSFTLDTTAPVAPDVALTDDTGALSDDLITSDGTLTVTPENADALVEYNNNGTGWSTTFTAVEGTNDVLVRQTDLAGNVSDETAFSFTLDTTAPAAPGVALTDDTGALSDDLITSDGALTVTPENADALVEYNNNGAGWSTTFTAVEGTNDVLVRQTDLAGNVSDETAFSFTLDTTAPAAPGVALTDDTGALSDDLITSDGTLTVTPENADALVEYNNNGAGWSTTFTAVEGTNDVLVRQTDLAGNVSDETAFSFTLDTTAPAAPGVALTDDTGALSDDLITSDGALTVTPENADALVEYNNNGAGWSTTFTAVEGTNDVLVRQTDLAGNVSDETALSFTLDTTAPAAPGVALTDDTGALSDDLITKNGALTVTPENADALVEYNNNGTGWSTTFTAVEGTNDVLVRQTDLAGNVSDETALSFTLDTTAPAAPGVALTDDTGALSDDLITSDGALTVTPENADALVEYNNNGAGWSTTFTAVEGTNDVLVRQTDLAGNVSDETSFSFTLDTTAPVAPGVALTEDTGALSDDLITKNGALTVTPENADALVEYNNNGAGWSTTFTAVEGTNDVLVRQTDLAGNVSDETAFSFTLDTTAPVAPGVALTEDTGALDDDLITKNGDLTVTPENADALVEYNNNGAGWSSTFTAVEGANDVLVRQTDLAGNVSDETAFSFTLDTTAPAAPGVALTDDTGALSDDLITSDGALTVTPENADALVEYNNNGAGWSSTFTAVEGTNDVLVRQTDLAGNVSDETAFSFTLDTTAPVAPDVALTDDTGALSDDLITSDGALTVTPENADALVEYNNNGAGWSSTFTAVEGTNDVLVRQTDLAGNVSDETAFSFTLDTQVPAAPGVALTSDTGSSASDKYTSNPALTLSAIEPSATVEYNVNNAGWTTSYSPVEGPNSVQVRQRDLAGNVGAATTFTFTLDTAAAAPGVALTQDTGSSAIDKITSNGALTLSGVESGATVEYNNNNGGWTSTFTAVQGTNSVQVHQTDLAGNVSNVTTFTFTLDTAAPVVTLGGSSGTESEGQTQAFTWNITDASGLSAVTVTVTKNGSTIYTSSAASSSFNFDSYGLGTFAINVSATDTAGNSISGASSSSASRSVVVVPVTVTLQADPSSTPSATQIQANFNGTPIAAGSTVWFNSVLKASGLSPTQPVTIQFINQYIDFTANNISYHLAVPNATITFSPTATTATTTFDAGSNTWITVVPSFGLAGNVFLSGLPFTVPAGGLPGGIKSVTWSGQFVSDTPCVTLNWQWAAAVYNQFSANYGALGVKPVDDNSASQYKNSDHAGTPESFKTPGNLLGGATGGGGSNWTGGYSGTASSSPVVATSDLVIHATSGNDTITVSQGSNPCQWTVTINGSSQTITAALGRIIVFGHDGDDTITVNGSVNAELHGGAGADTINGGSGNDVIWGDAGADTITGNAGNDVIIGGDGNDRLTGSAGNDILVAGELVDAFFGGATDRYAFLRAISDLWSASAGDAAGAQTASSDLATDSTPTANQSDDVTDTGTDQLTGSAGHDWLIIGTADKVTDMQKDQKADGDFVQTI